MESQGNRKQRRAAGTPPTLDPDAFLKLADRFIDVANRANQKVLATDIHMAFLYAAARYNAFVGNKVREVEDHEVYIEEMADFMASLTRNARTLSADAVNGMVGIFSELLMITLRQDDGTASAEARGKLKLAQELIEEGLSRHDLDPAVIAAKAGISRSRLYEMFKPHGGVASYIRRRRVHRFRALLSQRRDMRSIAELAFACGFASESHASRTFREIFAMPPGQFRRRQGGPASLPTVMAVVPGRDGFAPWVSSLNMRAQASTS